MKHNVVCLKWGDKLYGPDYVNKLYCAVKRNLTVPFTFHCFTERPQGIHSDVVTHELPHSLPGVGWWQKLYLFSKDVPLEGRVLYLDLDSLITGSLDEIVSYNRGFVCLRDLFLARMSPKYKDKFGLAKEAVGSGILSWEAGKHTQIWESFIKDPQKAVRSLHPHGDQKWIQKVEPNRTYWQDILPNQLVSFKVHCRSGLPKNARVVCYHGKPSIPESINTTTKIQGYTIKPTKWILQYWYDENASTNTTGETETSAKEGASSGESSTDLNRQESEGAPRQARCVVEETGREEKASRDTKKARGQTKTARQAHQRQRQKLRLEARRRRNRKV